MREFFIAETHSKTCSRLRKQKSLDGSKTAVWQEKCKENPRKNTDKERTFLFFSSIQYSTASHEIKAVCDSTYTHAEDILFLLSCRARLYRKS